jgi:hypothetical protein
MNEVGETGRSRKRTAGARRGRRVDASLACGWRRFQGAVFGGETEGEERICPAPPPGWFVGCACQEQKTVGQALALRIQKTTLFSRRFVGLVKGGLVAHAEESRRGAQHLSCSAPASAGEDAGAWWIDKKFC